MDLKSISIKQDNENQSLILLCSLSGSFEKSVIVCFMLEIPYL